MNDSRNLSNDHQPVFSTTEITIGSTVVVVLIILSFFGNLTTIYVFCRKPRLRTPTNITIIFLSITDILMALSVMPFSLVSFINRKWPFSGTACTLNAFLIGGLLAFSLFTMSCTAITRYFRVVRPSMHQSLTGKRSVLVISGFWFTILVLTAIPIFVDSGHGRYYSTRCFCRLHYQNRTVYWKIDIVRAMLSVVMGCTIFLGYYKVFRFVSRHNQAVLPNLQQGNHPRIEEVKVTRTLSLVVFGFVACWIPTGIIEGLDFISHSLGFQVPAFLAFQRTTFMFASSAVNPLIYGFTNKQFKKEFLEMFGRWRPFTRRQVLPAAWV